MNAARQIGAAMQAAFRSTAGLDSDLFAGKVSREGARIVDRPSRAPWEW
jgi:hypothetical protein